MLVWGADKGQELFSLKGHLHPVTGVAFSPDGKRILSGGGNIYDPGKVGEVKLWDAENGQDVVTLRAHRHNVKSVAFSPDGKPFLSTSQDRTIRVWDSETAQGLSSSEGTPRKLVLPCSAPTANGSSVAVRTKW